jgi:hypothetical protein
MSATHSSLIDSACIDEASAIGTTSRALDHTLTDAHRDRIARRSPARATRTRAMSTCEPDLA